VAATKEIDEERLREDLELIRHFRSHLRAIADGRVSNLLAAFPTEYFTNSEVRALFGLGRKGTWVRLYALVQLGILEKKAQRYRVSRFAYDLVGAVSTAMKSTIAGKAVPVNDALRESLRIAIQGLEMMYAKGALQQVDYAHNRRLLQQLRDEGSDQSISKLPIPPEADYELR
jgi:hypothetical protein